METLILQFLFHSNKILKQKIGANKLLSFINFGSKTRLFVQKFCHRSKTFVQNILDSKQICYSNNLDAKQRL